MNAMRVPVLLAAVVVASGGLAGCFGTNEDPVDPNAANPGENPPDEIVGGVVSILNPLRFSLAFEGETWQAPGSKVMATATTPSIAEGQVTYTWAFGSLPGTRASTATADTGTIEPRASSSLTFSESGSYLIHCHPHPWMKSNVTVVEGLEGPDVVHVQIVDDATLDTYRFVPENILVKKGAEVVYHNNGTQVHTATLEKHDDGLKLLPLTGASNEVEVSGEGWQRIVVVAQDEKGRIGSAEAAVYVSALPANFEKKFTHTFPAGGLPEQASTLSPNYQATFMTEHDGYMIVNYTAKDPADEGVYKVAVHVKQQGATQDTFTSEPTSDGTLEGHALGGGYQLIVEPKQGAQIALEVTVTVVYDLNPPAPSMSSGGGGDGHGGHAH